MKRTDEQIAVHKAISESKDNLKIQAVAGSGKTTTIVAGARFLERDSQFLAFNKSIASELQSRLPDHVNSSTFHSLGFQFLRQRLPKGMKVNGYKVYDLIDNFGIDVKESKRSIASAISIGKNLGVGLIEKDNEDIWYDICQNHDLFPVGNNPEEVSQEVFLKVVRGVFKQTTDNVKVIDFDDMLYLAYFYMKEYGWKPPQLPTIMVDEVQDTNELQMAILKQFTNRVIGVGDEHQAIYGFRGAGVDSMDIFGATFNTTNLPLSYTFRCPLSVVKEAQVYNKDIKARPDAPEGFVTSDRDIKALSTFISPNHLILCRNNAPLIGVALRLLRDKIPFNMSGKYPAQLQTFVKKFKAEHIQMFRVRLKDWWETTRDELEKKEKWGILQREEDKFESLWELQAQSTSIKELLDKLDYMTNNKSGVKIASIHASKGLEAEVVHFLHPEFIPSKYAVQEWQQKQENNLFYVGVTRAKEELHFYYG